MNQNTPQQSPFTLPCAPSLFVKAKPWALTPVEPHRPASQNRTLALEAAKELFQSGELGPAQYTAVLREVLEPQRSIPWTQVRFEEAI